jgi:hypothetical protein
VGPASLVSHLLLLGQEKVEIASTSMTESTPAVHFHHLLSGKNVEIDIHD